MKKKKLSRVNVCKECFQRFWTHDYVIHSECYGALLANGKKDAKYDPHYKKKVKSED